MKYVAVWLSAVIVAVYGLQQIIGTGTLLLDQNLMFSEPYRIITSIFAHGSLSHLMGNLFSLLLFGLMLEGRIGAKKTLMIFILSGIGINLLLPLMPYTRVLGASGAIFAVMGVLICLRPLMTIFIGFVPMPMIVAGIIWVIQDLFGVFYPSNVANMAHLAGLFMGILIGFYLRNEGYGDKFNRNKKKSPDERQIENELDNFERNSGLR